MNLDQLLSAYAARAKLGDIPKKPDGSRILIFDDQYKIGFWDKGVNEALAMSVVTRVPEDDAARRDFVDRVMAAAAGRMRGGREIVSLDEDGTRILLHRRFDPDMPPHAFDTFLTDFVNALAAFRRHLSAPAAPSVAPPPFQMLFR